MAPGVSVDSVLDNVRATLWQRMDALDTKNRAAAGSGGRPPVSLMDWVAKHEEPLLLESLEATKLNTRCFARAAVVG